ncbi:MAG: response regulator [Elusimicrobia bacterium]|nr:response regulator [Elusimicrobiota bacterium]
MPERTYTTHDIAKFCDVHPSSVMHWINGGKLRAHQTAGGHHRVTREDLIDFLGRLNMRLPAELVSRKRVLVVDDEEETANLIARAFSRLPDFEVETCGDGINALIRIGRQPPDLVILDIVIPKMDGIQVCRVLKEKPETSGIKIIAVSGQKLPFSEKKLVDLKIDGFFRKPLDLKELTGRAAELLRDSSAPRKSARAER